MWDAIVVGAGPAGAIAALILARGGHRTLLTDRIEDDRSRIGEALPEAAGRLLRSIGLPAPEADGPHAAVGGVFLSWNSDDLIALDSFRNPAGQGWRLDRERFDADLRAAAITAGASYRNDRVRHLCRQGGCWEVGLESGEVACARWVIDATGRSALLGRRLGVRRLRDTGLVALYAQGRPGPTLDINRTVIEAVKTGWWYAARLPSGAAIAGFHTDAREAARLRAEPGAWEQEFSRTRHVAHLFSGAQLEGAHAVDARGARLTDFFGEGWIACGDAAMCFDPISGQGILSALHGGLKAGTAVAAALDGRTELLTEYSARINDVWAIYRTRLRGIYQSERR
ncbi:MAG TPA: FAD-dependent monooxygenase [Sphingomonas sp.]|nr:FAD-dependent monooxygenase [Sphingomonas sp.]